MGNFHVRAGANVATEVTAKPSLLAGLPSALDGTYVYLSLDKAFNPGTITGQNIVEHDISYEHCKK